MTELLPWIVGALVIFFLGFAAGVHSERDYRSMNDTLRIEGTGPPMKELSISITLSLWPMWWTAGHSFDGEQHKWWMAAGPLGLTLWFEPKQTEQSCLED